MNYWALTSLLIMMNVNVYIYIYITLEKKVFSVNSFRCFLALCSTVKISWKGFTEVGIGTASPKVLFFLKQLSLLPCMWDYVYVLSFMPHRLCWLLVYANWMFKNCERFYVPEHQVHLPLTSSTLVVTGTAFVLCSTLRFKISWSESNLSKNFLFYSMDCVLNPEAAVGTTGCVRWGIWCKTIAISFMWVCTQWWLLQKGRAERKTPTTIQ